MKVKDLLEAIYGAKHHQPTENEDYEIVLRNEDGKWYGDIEILSVDEEPKQKKLFINFFGNEVIHTEKEKLL